MGKLDLPIESFGYLQKVKSTKEVPGKSLCGVHRHVDLDTASVLYSPTYLEQKKRSRRSCMHSDKITLGQRVRNERAGQNWVIY